MVYECAVYYVRSSANSSEYEAWAVVSSGYADALADAGDAWSDGCVTSACAGDVDRCEFGTSVASEYDDAMCGVDECDDAGDYAGVVSVYVDDDGVASVSDGNDVWSARVDDGEFTCINYA